MYIGLVLFYLTLTVVPTGLYALIPGGIRVLYLLLFVVVILRKKFFNDRSILNVNISLAVFCFFIFIDYFLADRELGWLAHPLTIWLSFVLPFEFFRRLGFTLPTVTRGYTIVLLTLFCGQVLDITGFLPNIFNTVYSDQMVFGLLRRPGGFMNPNETSAIALTSLCGLIVLKRDNVFHLILTLLIVILTQSRASILALFIVYLFFVKKNLSHFLLFFFISISIIYSGLFEYILIRFNGDSSSDYRFYLVQQAILNLSQYPLAGLGLGYFESHYAVNTHNTLLWLLVEGGVFFLIIGLLVIHFQLIILKKIFWIPVVMYIMFHHTYFTSYNWAFIISLSCYVSIFEFQSEIRNGKIS